MDPQKTFHLGLCMAGSISAGAYTAGVMDYFFEALNNWYAHKKNNDPSIPDHDVSIDVFGGSSGGGITAALSLFAQQETLSPMKLVDNSPVAGGYNLLYDTWVQMTGNDVFAEMLKPTEIKPEYVPALMNSGFIDTISGYFKDYLYKYKGRPFSPVPYINPRAELFLTLFNLTGIRYELLAKTTAEGVIRQYAVEHRDLAHFRIAEKYENDGRMPLDTYNEGIIDILIEAAMATGAFPGGLSSRFVNRPKKFLWENPYINKNGRFTWDKIKLDSENQDIDFISDGREIYRSLNADGGVANNEPIEISRHLLQNIRKDMYGPEYENCLNSSIILIDPFPSFHQNFERPGEAHQHLLKFSGKLIMSMQNQLLFDAKTMLEAYNRANHGLYLIAPSKDGYKPEHAIACGSLGGFGGFLAQDFRIHDFFLGRHNCQSFLRKYFVVDVNGNDGDNGQVRAVLNGYKKEEAFNRYARKDAMGIWVPIIPDMNIRKPEDAKDTSMDLPVYHFERLSETSLNHYYSLLEERFGAVVGNLVSPGSMAAKMGIAMLIENFEDDIANYVLNYIKNDLKRRKLMQR